MAELTLIIGGARSGKSKLAVKLAQRQYRKVAFIATCEPLDREMRKRILQHKRNRPCHWQTFDEPLQTAKLIRKTGNKFDCIILDCLTLQISNLLLQGRTEKKIEQEIKNTCSAGKKVKANLIIVSNEVGMGIVPENKLTRAFRDIAGRANQIAAGMADKVFFLSAGLSLRLK